MKRAIADLVVLLRDELLVRYDSPDDTLAEIFTPHGRKILLRPQTAKSEAAGSAIVLGAGPLASPLFQPGLRIALSRYAGTEVALEGVETEDRVKVIRPEQVLLLLPGTTGTALAQKEAADQAEPPPGHLLAERAEMPLRRGRIELPPGAKEHTRAAEAVIRKVAPDIEQPLVKVGDYVLLGLSVTRWIGFGKRAERELWVLTESQIVCRLKDEEVEGAVIVNRGESPFENWEGVAVAEPEEKFDEGDPAGLR